MRSASSVRETADPSVPVRVTMFAKIALAYLVIACAMFAWLARQCRFAPGEHPQIDAANRVAPKSVALMLASFCLLGAIFWPASLVGRVVVGALSKRVEKEIHDDDDDDGMPQEA